MRDRFTKFLEERLKRSRARRQRAFQCEANYRGTDGYYEELYYECLKTETEYFTVLDIYHEWLKKLGGNK